LLLLEDIRAITNESDMMRTVIALITERETAKLVQRKGALEQRNLRILKSERSRLQATKPKKINFNIKFVTSTLSLKIFFWFCGFHV
jgi:hypothetical protein